MVAYKGHAEVISFPASFLLLIVKYSIIEDRAFIYR